MPTDTNLDNIFRLAMLLCEAKVAPKKAVDILTASVASKLTTPDGDSQFQTELTMIVRDFHAGLNADYGKWAERVLIEYLKA